jgi:hypothetical protein
MKSLMELVPGQTVNYPSRNMRVTRAFPKHFEDGSFTAFQVKRNYPEGTLSVRCEVPESLTDIWKDSPEFMLDYFELEADQLYRWSCFKNNMSSIKRGIRANVKRHLRRKYGKEGQLHVRVYG